MSAIKAKLRVTQVKSTIGQQHTMGATIHGLGLKGPGTTVVVANTPSFRGAVKKVMHLVRVEEIDNG
jgi:large subunit ribosomal protein L30